MSNKCQNCEKYFMSNIKKTYCDNKCKNQYHDKKRTLVLLICKNCNNEFKTKHKEQKFCGLKCSAQYNHVNNIHSKNTYSEMGKKSTAMRDANRTLRKDIYKICLYCGKTFNNKPKEQKYCNIECSRTHNIILMRNGTIQMNTNNRGKGEIYFAELCIKYFGEDDILCNEKIFKDKNGGLWDADIIIKSLKLAILYDGIFHFKQVKKGMNLNQIKSRDRIKRRVISDNGYKYYTVKDLGRFNKNFVINEFNLFIHKLNFKNTINELIYKSLFISYILV